MINTQSYELNMPYFMLDLSWLTCWHHRETIHSSILHSNHGWLTCWHPRVTIHCSILHTIQGWIWWLKSLIKASQSSFKITRTPLLVRLLASLGKILTSDTALKQWCWKTTQLVLKFWQPYRDLLKLQHNKVWNSKRGNALKGACLFGGRLFVTLKFLNFVFGFHCTHDFSGSVTCIASLVITVCCGMVK